jgi:predicted transcriptional regulator YdeE
MLIEKTIMKLNVVTKEEKKIIGVETRTSNSVEANPQTAKIPALWQKFFQVEEKIPNRKNADTMLGTYTNYESDHNGEYSLIVSSEVSSLDDIPNKMVGIAIPTARYLVFTAEGQMPAALIETWAQIWQYFSANPEYQRAYTTDFELHDKNNESRAEVYIAVKRSRSFLSHAAQQIVGSEGETAAFLSHCLFNSELLAIGFAPRQFNRSAFLFSERKQDDLSKYFIGVRQ